MSKQPVRLAKQDNGSPFLNKLDDWAISHAHIILPIFIIMGLILFVALCFAICGVCAVESGVQYHMESWI